MQTRNPVDTGTVATAPGSPFDDAIQLDFTDGARLVAVSPKDQDRFVTTCEIAAQACQQYLSFEDWRKQFRALLSHVHAWMINHGDRIHACYISPCDGGLMVYVVPKSDSYDAEIEDQLTDLDIELHQKFPLCRCDVSQIPGKSPERLRAFLNITYSVEVYGDTSRARREVEA